MPISRRSFLKGIAASAMGVAAANLIPQQQAAVAEEAAKLPAGVPAWLGVEPEVSFDQCVAQYDTEVLVVGSGTAGWPAYAAALENGAKAIMIERGAKFGSPKGDLGSIGSKKQLEAIAKDEKYFIDKHECVKDIVKNSASSVDTRLWYIWANDSAEAVDWYTDILEKNDYTMWLEAGVGTPGGRDKAWPTGHSPASNSKETLGVADVLKNYTDSLGGTAMTETTLIKLVKSGERVTGAICQNAEGKYILINASKGVIIATGGYSGNREMLEARQPLTLKLASRQGSADNGSGIKAALWAGAMMQYDSLSMFFNRTAIMPDAVSGYDTPGKNFWFGEQPFMKVNLNGERFCNESGLYEYLTHSVQFQKDYTYCDIWDSTFAEDVDRFEMLGCSRLELFDNGAPSNWTLERAWQAVEGLIEEGFVIKADTIEELAEKLGLPVENLVASVARYNELEAKGHDDDFGKVAYRLSRIDTPPYYGVRCSAWHLCTLDGVLINQNMQAITPSHDPIEGLYVVGDASGGTFSGVYPNLCTGLAAGRSLTFGRRAGRIAAGAEAAQIAPVEIGGEQAGAVAAGDGNGTYTAKATGMNDVSVTITFENGVAKDVIVDTSAETAGIGKELGEKFAEAIKAGNTPNVDAVSGATLTSGAVAKAAASCFEQAGVAF